MLDALESRQPVVVPDRYEAVMQDPAWAPLHDFMRHPRWDWFVSVPLLARGEPVGILNAFFAPGQVVGDTELEFLLAMAEQAALAVDHASLLERERDVARREERQKLAHDLHDSVVQQVFSMMMQAKSLGVLVARGLPPAPEEVAQVAEDLSGSAGAVLADLRGMVVELRPAATTAQGLASALRSLVDTTAARTGVDVSLDYLDPDAELAALDADLVEDVYRVVAEALHNSVKHAGATWIRAQLAVTSHGSRRRLVAEVTDDGRGLDPVTASGTGGGHGGGACGGAGSSGLGMTVMRERAARWGGAVRVRQRDGGGTSVLLTLPLPTSLPAAGAEVAQ
jgi:signal transduction histidine kinase